MLLTHFLVVVLRNSTHRVAPGTARLASRLQAENHLEASLYNIIFLVEALCTSNTVLF